MKKPNRLAAKNGDTATKSAQAKRPAKSPDQSIRISPLPRAGVTHEKPLNGNGAQSKATPTSPANSGAAESAKPRNLTPIYGSEIGSFESQRLYRDGHTYYLVTDYEIVSLETPGLPDMPGQTVQEMTREQARAWLDATVIEQMIPAEFHRDFRHRRRAWTPSTTPDLMLGEVLSVDSLNGLNKLGADGVNVPAQVAGAVASWLSYAQWLTENRANGADEVKAAPGVLESEFYEHVHAQARASFLSEGGAQLYRALLTQARQMPLADAEKHLSRLADLIEYHPGLADEFKALNELLDAQSLLGKSTALKQTLEPA